MHQNYFTAVYELIKRLNACTFVSRSEKIQSSVRNEQNVPTFARALAAKLLYTFLDPPLPASDDDRHPLTASVHVASGHLSRHSLGVAARCSSDDGPITSH